MISQFNTQFDVNTSKNISVSIKIIHEVQISFYLFLRHYLSGDQLPSTSLPPPSQLVQNKELLFYVHIPFCQSKCHYCNFAVDTRQSPKIQERYTKALTSQIKYWSDLLFDPSSNASVKGIDIGKK
jgi:coproporphyrinogen III oxidase-like Fe-S oxidoreductase